MFGSAVVYCGIVVAVAGLLAAIKPIRLLRLSTRQRAVLVAAAGIAEDAPRELVIGTVVIAPPGTGGTLNPEMFQKPLPPGFAVAAMNFLVRRTVQVGRWCQPRLVCSRTARLRADNSRRTGD